MSSRRPAVADPGSLLPHLVLAAGVAVVSTASILIRYALDEGAGSAAIAALRLVFATVLLTPFALARCGREVAALDRRTLGLALGSGVVLAVHFATWIASLQYTSVAASAVLVTTNPIWVGLAAWLVLGEPVGRRGAIGIGLGMAGAVAVFLADGSGASGTSNVLGNSLALAGALAASGYLLIGRGVRARLSLTAYIWLVYGAAALALTAFALLQGSNLTGLSWLAYGCILAMAAGPQLIGHTTFNWAVRRLPAPTVAMAILGEPVGAALLAWLLFDETASAGQLVGFSLLLAGIYVTSRADAKRQSPGEDV